MLSNLIELFLPADNTKSTTLNSSHRVEAILLEPKLPCETEGDR